MRHPISFSLLSFLMEKKKEKKKIFRLFLPIFSPSKKEFEKGERGRENEKEEERKSVFLSLFSLKIWPSERAFLFSL